MTNLGSQVSLSLIQFWIKNSASNLDENVVSVYLVVVRGSKSSIVDRG